MIFRQLFDRETCTYTYLLADSDTKEGILIDPVDTMIDRDLSFCTDLGINLKYVANTHIHADHITSSGLIKQRLPDVKSVLGVKAKPAHADIYLNDNERLQFGNCAIVADSTPGHTDGCTSYKLDDFSKVFTGDALFIRGCGRTDFQQGSSEHLWESVHTKLFTLPDSCEVYPGHDYKGRTKSTIGEEKKFNPRLTKSKPDFVELMHNLKLGLPARIDVAVPGNLVCGYVTAEPGEALTTVAIAARVGLPNCVIVDCRTEAEKASGKIDGALGGEFLHLSTDDEEISRRAGDELKLTKDSVVVAYCRSGRRSGLSAKKLVDLGFMHAVNGGTMQNVEKAISMKATMSA